MKKNYYMRNKIALRSQIELERAQMLLDQQHGATRENLHKRKRLQLEYDLELANAFAGDDNENLNIQSNDSSINKLECLDNNLPSSQLQDEILLEEQIEVFHSPDKICNGEENSSDDEILVDEQIEGIHSTDKICYEENSSDAGSVDDELNNTDLKKSLATWALKHNTSHQSLSELLKILQPVIPEHNLPGDARSLLQTKRSFNFESISSDKSNFYYFGIEKNIVELLQHTDCDKIRNKKLGLSINIDGIPICKSSSESLWPILGSIDDLNKVFVIAIYCGTKKPNVSEYLEKFVNELDTLINDGFTYSGFTFFLQIKSFICDTPARALIKQVKGHTGYYACERCKTRGEFKNHSMSYNELDAEKRTNDSFLQKEQSDHHIGVSPLERVSGINMISMFILDYMHLILLGIVRRLLQMWWNMVPFKFSCNDKKIINDRINLLKNYIPCEFSRKCRSFQDLDRFKATEFRLFLLYIGPAVLEGILPVKMFQHFCILHVIIRIFCSKSMLTKENIDYAQCLCLKFVRNFQKLYGCKQNIVYNVHNLIHIHEDVRRYGTLDSISAFKYETLLGTLKRRIRGGSLPLQQVCGRITELADCPAKATENKPDKNKIVLINGTLNLKHEKESAVQLNDKTYCIVLNKQTNGMVNIKRFKTIKSAYSYPINSEFLDIYHVKLIHKAEQVLMTSLHKKCMILPHKELFTILPLLE